MALIESLRRHGAEIRTARDPYTALTLACRATHATAEAHPDRAAPRAILILLVDPPALTDPAGFVDAVRRYAPRSACWWYHSGASPAFRAVTPADLESWRAPPSAPDRESPVARGPNDANSQPLAFSPAGSRAPHRARPGDPAGPLRRMTPEAQPAPATGQGPPRLRLAHADTQRPGAPSPPLPPDPEPKPPPRAVAPPLPLSEAPDQPADAFEHDPPLLTAEELAILLGDADDPLPPEPPDPPTTLAPPFGPAPR